jgi:hypothetical protein
MPQKRSIVGLKGNSYELQCEQATRINGKLFVKNNDKVNEIICLSQLGYNSSWNVMPNSTKFLDGIIYQNILGIHYISIPYTAKSGKTALLLLKVDELQGFRVIEGKCDVNVIILVAYKDKKYYEFTLKFDYSAVKYKCSLKDVDYYIPNFITLDNGIVVKMSDDGAIEMFSSNLDKPDIKRIEDPTLKNVRLYKKGIEVYVVDGNKLFRFKMKQEIR